MTKTTKAGSVGGKIAADLRERERGYGKEGKER
jgi:hypothetical protein